MDRAQNLSVPDPNNVPRVLQISSKSVPFWGVIAEHVNTVFLPRRIFPLLDLRAYNNVLVSHIDQQLSFSLLNV